MHWLSIILAIFALVVIVYGNTVPEDIKKVSDDMDITTGKTLLDTKPEPDDPDHDPIVKRGYYGGGYYGGRYPGGYYGGGYPGGYYGGGYYRGGYYGGGYRGRNWGRWY